MELPQEIYERIENLSNEGNEFFDSGQFDAAIVKWSEAFDLLPEPKPDWEAATWLLVSIGYAYYQQGKLDQARTNFFDALNSLDAQSNPFIHYRLGQCEIKLGNQNNGVEHLLRAYMLDGEAIFNGEVDGAKYLDILKIHGHLK